MSPDEYCRERVAPSGSTFHYCFRLVRDDRRRALFALHALCREIGETAGGGGDPGVARIKLAWWRGEIAAIYEGTPTHPVALALRSARIAHPLARHELESLVDAASHDLDRPSFADFPALEAHCAGRAGRVAAMSATLLGCRDHATPASACRLGIALRLTEVVATVGRDARRGRIYLPRDELARFAVAPEDVVAYRSSEQFVALMAMQAARAREHIRAAVAALPEVDRRALRPGLALAAIGRSLLDEIGRDGYRVLEHRLALTPLRKLAIATWVLWTGRAG